MARLVFFLAAVLTLAVPAGNASAAAWSTTATRVGVAAPVSILPVGVPGHISAGQHPVRAGPQLRVVSGDCVFGEEETGGTPDESGVNQDLLDKAERIQQHLERLDYSPANDAMLDRLRAAAIDGTPLSEADQNFINHELTEAGLMDDGMGYDEAHEIAGRTHPTFGNYDPEVIKQFPELFNQNWRNFWGME